MAWIVAVLAIISLVAGGLLGTFRHRAYGVWSLAGVLVAIVTANIVGTSVGIWMAASIGTTEASPVLVLVKTSVLVITSLIISYYASDLIPVQQDPKTRSDNIKAGSLGVFNAYMIVATMLVYVQGLNNAFSANIFGDGQSFNFNRMIVDGLPWITSVLVLTIVGWSSVRKFKQAWAKLRGTSNATSSTSTGLMTNGANYQYSSPASGFNPSSGAAAPPPSAESTEKKGWFSGLSGWFRRDTQQAESDVNSANSSMTQAPSSASYSPATYQGTSGATPPYGIATGSTGYNPTYNSTPATGSSYSNTSTGYTAPTYSGYSATPATSAPTPSYSSNSYTSPATTPAYSPTTSYTPPPATNPGYTPPASSYGGSSTTSSTSYPSGYSASTNPPSTYNPGVSSGFAPASPSSTPDATVGGLATGGIVGGLAAGGLFGSTFANASTSNDFSNMNDYQDSDEEESYYDEDEDDDSQDGYSQGYRG